MNCFHMKKWWALKETHNSSNIGLKNWNLEKIIVLKWVIASLKVNIFRSLELQWSVPASDKCLWLVFVTLSTLLFIFHLISFSPHLIVHVSFLLLSVHSPSHSFYLPQSISFIFTLFGCIHITWPFNLIVIFTFQPIPSLEIDDLRLSLDKFLILDRYLLLEAELRWFYYSLSLCIKQEIQQYFPSYLRKGGIDSWRLFNLGGRGVTITRKKRAF